MEKADYVTPANAIAVFDALPPTDYVEVCSIGVVVWVNAFY